MLKIMQYLKKRDWLFMICSLVFIVTQVWLDLKLPDYMSKITMLIETSGSKMSQVFTQGGYMILCAVGSMAASMLTGYFIARVGAALSMRLRGAVFDKTLSFSMEEISGFSTASLITRSTNDITQIQLFVTMGMQAAVKAPIMAVWAIYKIAGKGWQWTLTTGIAVFVLIILMSVIIFLAVPKSTKIQQLTDNLNRVTREHLTGLRVVRAFNAEEFQGGKFEKANGELTAANLFVNRIMALLMPGMSMIQSGMTVGIYVVGAVMIGSAETANRLGLFSNMVVFSSYAMQVIMAFMMLSMTFIMLPRAIVAARRVLEVINTEAKIIDGVQTEGIDGKQGEIEFRNVSFSYPDAEEAVIHDVSFVANSGETVAFIGSTGCGKSTVINLVPRFYDATDGQVFVDGLDVKEYTQEALRSKIGYVPQKSVLFSGTVSSNVAFGDNGRAEPDDTDIANALRIAQGTEFVEKMDGTYDARISQGGSNISGGQKQRLSIARAVCRKPEIYIFDDSFSALDYKTDRVLRSALKNEVRDATVMIVAQRIGTIRDADRIIVLENGAVVGSGTHRELMKNCEVYREIAYSQLTEEELDYA